MSRLRSFWPALVSVVLSLAGSPAVWGQTYVEGSVEPLIKEIRNAMPLFGSNGFVVPTSTELDRWGEVFTAVRSGNYAVVPHIVALYGYSFLCLYDTSAAETLYTLRENVPVQRGWGTYIFHPRGRNDLAVEVPHPRYDTNTCMLGIRAFMKLEARWFSMAGTHRYANLDSSSDMAHVTQSVFHKAHQTSETSRAIQIHGFDRSNPIYNGYPEIVISNGTRYPPAILNALKSNYESRGFTAGVFSESTYAQLWRLGATQNKQGQWSNANGKAFVHIEHDYPIRVDSVRMAAAIQALYETFTPTNSVQIGLRKPIVFALEQNYPNPFNPATTIRYAIREAGHVSLSVLDLLGREVARLVDGVEQPGHKSVGFSRGELASGVYMYRLRAGGFVETKKLLLIR